MQVPAYITPFYSNLENEGLFSNSLPLRWWEVLCHPTGMCKPSIPPTLLHPEACTLLRAPSLQIKKHVTSPCYLVSLCAPSDILNSCLIYFRKKSIQGRSMDSSLNSRDEQTSMRMRVNFVVNAFCCTITHLFHPVLISDNVEHRGFCPVSERI